MWIILPIIFTLAFVKHRIHERKYRRSVYKNYTWTLNISKRIIIRRNTDSNINKPGDLGLDRTRNLIQGSGNARLATNTKYFSI